MQLWLEKEMSFKNVKQKKNRNIPNIWESVCAQSEAGLNNNFFF